MIFPPPAILIDLSIWSMNEELFAVFAATSATFFAPLTFRKSTFRLVNVFLPASDGKLFLQPNMFG